MRDPIQPDVDTSSPNQYGVHTVGKGKYSVLHRVSTQKYTTVCLFIYSIHPVVKIRERKGWMHI